MILRKLVGVTLVACALATVAGCGGSSSSGGGGGAGGAKNGGILRIGITAPIDSLNPFVAINTAAYNVFVMVYPQLVQYVPPGLHPVIHGDWATSWDTSKDGLTWTFHLRPGTKWSDGKPMTSADVVWTGNTIVKYASGATAAQAAALTHVTKFTAPDPNTVVIHYSKPVGNVLPQLEQFWIYPKHIWAKFTGNNGKDLKTVLPEQHLPLVSGGPYTVTKYDKNGTTVFRPNPSFYGPKSHAEAVAETFYTNTTSMVADLKAGTLDYVSDVPPNAVNSVKGDSRFQTLVYPSAEITNITFNSNPLKPKNRELLDPQVKKALEYATDREQIIKVVFNGYGKPTQNLIWSGAGALFNPNVKPLPFDIAKANALLDQLGYKRGSDGIRVAPATTGKFAQPAHKMEYDIMIPNGVGFNADREFSIISSGWAKAGVKVHEVSGGDTSQAYAYETAGSYTKFDMALWDWGEYVDPDFLLSVLTRSQWFSWSDTGFNNPTYNKQYEQQGTTVDPAKRKALVWKMQEEIANWRPYIQLAELQSVAAHTTKWTGIDPNMNAYCKCYFTDAHLS